MQRRDGRWMSEPSKCFVGHTKGGEKGPEGKSICYALLPLPKIIMDLRRQ